MSFFKIWERLIIIIRDRCQNPPIIISKYFFFPKTQKLKYIDSEMKMYTGILYEYNIIMRHLLRSRNKYF